MDANALFLPFSLGILLGDEAERLLGPVDLAVPSSVRLELETLVARKAPAAEAARELSKRFPTVRAAGRGDGAVLAAAVRRQAVVVTADRGLALRLREVGVPVLKPRGPGRLALALPRRGSTSRPTRPAK
ncbi:MAG: hypothetical protein L3K09_00240 [Thermoplasmata archaeon]|nr:hypothetical protein [Thermoplasmata archaeon]